MSRHAYACCNLFMSSCGYCSQLYEVTWLFTMVMYFVVVITWLFTVVICGCRCFTIVMYDCCSWLPWLCSCLPWRCITVRHGFHAYVVVWHDNAWLLLVVTLAIWLFYHGDVCMLLVVAWLFTKCCMSLVCCHVVILPWWCMHVARGYVVVSSQWFKSVAMRDTTPALNRTRELCLLHTFSLRSCSRLLGNVKSRQAVLLQESAHSREIWTMRVERRDNDVVGIGGLDGRAKANSSNCSLEKLAVGPTAVCLCVCPMPNAILSNEQLWPNVLHAGPALMQLLRLFVGWLCWWSIS